MKHIFEVIVSVLTFLWNFINCRKKKTDAFPLEEDTSEEYLFILKEVKCMTKNQKERLNKGGKPNDGESIKISGVTGAEKIKSGKRKGN